MKIKNQTLVYIQYITLRLVLLLSAFVLVVNTVAAQDEIDDANELQNVSKVSGGGGGGGLNISKQNGGVSYSYPISRQSVGGHPLSVSLNYCGSVGHNYFSKYEYSHGFWPFTDKWSSFNKVAPEWLLSVNGFAVQTLSSAIKFYGGAPIYSSASIANARWLIEGYDYCNRMNQKLYGDQDVIKILRGDGSVLELRNPNTVIYGTLRDSSSYIGRYYSNAVNDNSYGYVHFDSTYWTSYIKDVAPDSMPEHYKFIPRLLHYFQGDGLEYIFREHVAPYGISSAAPQKYAGAATPTIFYLDEIRSGEQSVTKFTYNRHYPTETNIDTTINRAMISEFQGHRININGAYITIEALGRTFKVRYGSTWSDKDWAEGIYADTTLYAVGALHSIGSKYGFYQRTYNDASMAAISTSGFVTAIFDPLDRATQFEYKFQTKRYQNSYTIGLGRMTKISDPSGYTTIDYHTGNGTIETDSMQNHAKRKLVYDFHTIAGKVSSYNKNNTLLTSRTYTFDNNPSSYNRKSTIINYDSIAGLRDTTEYFYTYSAVTPYFVEADATQEALTWAPLEKTINYSPLGKSTGITQYAGSGTTGTNFLYVPVERTVSFKPVQSTIGTTVSHTKMEYNFTNLHDFGIDSTFGALMAKGISKQKTIEFYPHSDTSSILDTLLVSVAEYMHLPMITSTVSRTDTSWNFKRSWFVTDSLRALGTDTTAIIYQTSSISSASVISPPMWGLTKCAFVMKSGDTLAGVKNSYQTLLSTTAPRGALLADTLRGGNGQLQPGTAITYRGGWYRNFPIAAADINGAKSEILFDYSAASAGTMVTTDAQRLSRKLFNRRNEFETALGGRSIVRKPEGVLGGVVSDTLLGFAEFGYYGSAVGSIDANGYFSASKYDNVGRATLGWQTFDFPPFWNTKTDRIRL